MPYPANVDLPPSVRAHLPDHARDIYREAFNHAYAHMRLKRSGGEGAPHSLGGR